MKISFKFSLFVPLIALLFLATSSFAQGSQRPSMDPEGMLPNPPRNRPGMQEMLRRQLGLSKTQLVRLREINQQGRSEMQEANRLLREANRELDLAIYADTIDEQTIADKLLQFQNAQARVAELRFKGELEIRKILTAEQLVKFRELREKASQHRDDSRKRIQRKGQTHSN